jgi:hypothetical protein
MNAMLPQLPITADDPFAGLRRSDLRALIAELELANFRAEQKAIDLAHELKAARARERQLVRLLKGKLVTT